jgi:hypothetical protein
MQNYTVWNRQDKINGQEASYFLNSTPFKNCTHDIILIMNESGQVIQIECKNVLANHYNIDIELDIDSFMEQYFAILEELEQQQAQEV